MAANALPLQEERQLFARENNQALTALTFLSSRFEDLSEANVLSQCEMQEALKSIDQMVEAFNGATKLKNTPIPAPLEHVCAILAFLYVYTAPIALASYSIGQTNQAGEPSFYNTSGACAERGLVCEPLLQFHHVALRTMFASFWTGLAFFGIFELGNCFTDPFGDDNHDLGAALMTMGNGLEADLRSILEHRIPNSLLRRSTVVRVSLEVNSAIVRIQSFFRGNRVRKQRLPPPSHASPAAGSPTPSNAVLALGLVQQVEAERRSRLQQRKSELNAAGVDVGGSKERAGRMFYTAERKRHAAKMLQAHARGEAARRKLAARVTAVRVARR